ncbi:M48 family metallopeptidase [Fimbriimonas ginsengisoli]|uniref:M48 family metallopeptidase n=1 Tax=Fimbriimonas ginsengisoli TaxID=1005039 RepID=UPI00046D2D98|nr:SprT family zinc-dependent metalloprotease [Fimbriimonas ginsengisoli]
MTVELGPDDRLQITLHRLERKTLAITVHPGGEVEVRAPLTATDEEVAARVRRRRAWIRRQKDFFAQFKPRTPPRQYVSGETHLYLGRQYRLKTIEGSGPPIRVWAGYIEVTLKIASPDSVRKALWKWYRCQAERHFEFVLAKVQKEFHRKLPVEVAIEIRQFSHRWGTCHPDGRISLNVDLIRAPRSCIEYVVLHELCHLLVPDHSRAFFRLLDGHMPDWRERKTRLERLLA